MSKANAANEGWNLFHAEAAYADSIVRTSFGDIKGAIAALKCCLGFNPDYAPAILSMGSVEYQRGRDREGRKLFQSLLLLPDDTVDLCEIVDKAGSFLIQSGEYHDGLELYRAAIRRFPNVAVFHQGAGCCAGHRGLHHEAIEASKYALELDPGNQQFANDLGWSLFEAGRLQEAKETLERAVAMEPSDTLAQENLRICLEKISNHATNDETG
jgi:tetratricopeptide (TPR) repeat protein